MNANEHARNRARVTEIIAFLDKTQGEIEAIEENIF
jgi:hypothetical protein